jgi:hypothetical protein
MSANELVRLVKPDVRVVDAPHHQHVAVASTMSVPLIRRPVAAAAGCPDSSNATR